MSILPLHIHTLIAFFALILMPTLFIHPFFGILKETF